MKKIFYSTIRFLREVKIEMKRVSWPTKKDVRNYTIIVIVLSVLVGVYLGGLDLLLKWILSNFVI